MGENDIAKENNSSFEQTLCFWHWPLCGASHTTHTHSFIQQRKSQGQKLQNKTKIIIFLFILYIQQKTANTQKKKNKKNWEKREREREREMQSVLVYFSNALWQRYARGWCAPRESAKHSFSSAMAHTHTRTLLPAHTYIYITRPPTNAFKWTGRRKRMR